MYVGVVVLPCWSYLGRCIVAEENRVRYRLSVSPELNDRVELLSKKIGVHPQQAAYLCMGLGLNVLEQLTDMTERALQNPELLRGAMSRMEGDLDTEADKLAADASKQ